MHILIVGGSDGGISAALRIRELDRSAEVTVVLADAYPNYSICGLPFYLSGETPDWHSLAHRTKFEGIALLPDHTVDAIDTVAKTARARNHAGTTKDIRYDRVIVATGAVPIRPRLSGIDLPGVYLLHTMEDSFALDRWIKEREASSAVIVGGGYIGLEMADALTHRGLAVTVVDQMDTILTTVDASFGGLVRDEMRRHGVKVATGETIAAIEAAGQGLAVNGSDGFKAQADLVLVAVGVRPSTQLAEAAGAELGARNAIRVTRQMRTNVPDMFAAGDCTETWHRSLRKPVYLPLGTTAHKQGRIAGENALDGDRSFAGSLGSQAVKLFDLAVARTGLRESEARAEGFDAVTSETKGWDHKVYYPGAQELRIRVTGDRRTGQLLGAQLLGDRRSEVSKRSDIFAAALFHGMTAAD
jgi:NADPH-dependent 2,4-dienoyl-CoA reductase/sulfur reductase-like enzyme